MVSKPPVFISATSDLRSARDLVGKVLSSLGFEPRWQDTAPTDGGKMLQVLRRWIDPCEMVIQLVGDRYGAEPREPTVEFQRVSYTQFEALYAESRNKRVIYLFIEPSFPRDAVREEDKELVQLQAAYKQKLIADNQLRHRIGSPDDLQLSIHRIRDELELIRRQGERRFRRMIWLAAGSLAGITVLCVMTFKLIHQQQQTHEQVVDSGKQVKDELSALREELRAAVAPKPMAAGQSKPEALSPALLEKARFLLERGDAEDKALAQIALKQHADADRIIQELKRKPDNPIDDAVRLLTLEGNNWYQAGQFDKAIEPYEQAMALKPKEITARNSVTLAHSLARLGDLAAHEHRAIEIAEGTLQLTPVGSGEWAMTQNNLGNAWCDLPTGDRGKNLGKAITAFEAALTVYTKEADPSDWAKTQNNLGTAWADLPTGDRGENLGKAIAAFEAALTVLTKEADPSRWAGTQNNLGASWKNLPTGDRGENLSKAITAYQAALTIYTKEADPSDWAMTQNNLGVAWLSLPTGDRGENLGKALAAFEAALTIYTKEADPSRWAAIQNNLGAAWRNLPTGDRGENLSKAITAYQAALTIYTKDADPSDWAMTQNNLGVAWKNLTNGNREENLSKAIAAYEAALTIYTKEADPSHWAGTHYNLAMACADLADQPGMDQAAWLTRAIASGKAALIVRTETAYPREHASTLKNLNIDRRAYESTPVATTRPFDSIPPAE